MILATYIIISVIQVSYWIIFCRCLVSNRPGKHSFIDLDPPPVSIVVCFKNEAQNLPQLLPFLCSQDYPEYEIILVNDHSCDQSCDVIAAYNHELINTQHLPDGAYGKKRAQELGISTAQYDIILVTDADCSGTTQWIRTMVRNLPPQGMVLGYAPLKYLGTTASLFSVFETWITAVQYCSYALAGMPYMGVGRNMIFYKSLFDKVEGHQSHMDLPSGDDDLFVNAAANHSKVVVQLDPSGHIWSDSKSSWKAFIRQKRRHLTTSFRYKLKHQMLLSLFALSQMGFYLLPVLCMILMFKCTPLILIIFAFALSIKYVLALKINTILPGRKIALLFPLMDLMLALYYLVMPIFMMKKQNSKWK